ncbi:MAG: type II secretion system protein, partial [Rickettsiales bacterium]
MSNQIKSSGSRGFTLVELSIVIVIIGFLVAGIAAGANMVKQAEIRSVITDLQSYQTAYNNFVAKYNAVPGDMTTASSFWTGNVCG